MKRSLVFSFAIGLLLSGTVAMAGTAPGTGIKQTSHDLSSGGVGASYDGAATADPLDRICVYCHAPHHAITPEQAATEKLTYFPLWNHKVTALSYATYTNGSDVPNSIQHQFNGADTLGEIGSVSRLCLSCHDGSVALSAYGYAPSKTLGSTTGAKVDAVDAKNKIGGISAGSGSLGDLRNHHPVGFDYNAVAELDDEINPADSDLLGANTYGLTIGDLLWNGRMECSSCHDVHNTKNEGNKFTWVMDEQSKLCLTCHNK